MAIAIFFLAVVAGMVFALALGEVQARLAALYPHPEFQSRYSKEAAIECFLFVWTNEHRRIQDRILTQAVLRARWVAAAMVLFASISFFINGFG